jgi:hypothetical protein
VSSAPGPMWRNWNVAAPGAVSVTGTVIYLTRSA